jgi:hypothetical protein
MNIDINKLTLLNKHITVNNQDECYFAFSLEQLGFSLSQCSIMKRDVTTNKTLFHITLTSGESYAILTKGNKITQVEKQLF